MSLWAKIQSLNTDCQRQILSLYNEEHPKYKFPIEVRNLFAEVIESAVCGGNIDSIEKGLDPYNAQHGDQIINFLSSLTNQLEERLGNNQSGDQFFTQHKLSEALANFKEKKQADPLGIFDHIRNRIKAEVDLVVEQEANALDNMTQERDSVLDNIQVLKTEIAEGNRILKEIRANEESFALNCNKKQEVDAILKNPEQLQSYIQQMPDYEVRIKGTHQVLEVHLQQNVSKFQTLIQGFERTITINLQNVSILQGQIILEKLALWKHEQQQMANGIPKVHAVTLDRLQLWCEELAELIWKCYEQLKEAELILQNGSIPTGNASMNLTFVHSRTDDVMRLLQELLNKSFIVEEQPTQIIKMKTKFPKAVIVSLLVGKRLNINMNSPELTTCIISEDQAKALPVTDILDPIGEITNGKVMMDKSRDDFRRITFPLRNMQLKTIKRTDRRGTVSSERVMEEKSCLYFQSMVTVGTLKFKVATISLPVVVISHGSQEALAVASISWDNAFGDIHRIPFAVPSTAPWEDIAKILNAKFLEATGRGLTSDNLSCLAKKAFRNAQPQPDTINWSELCKENLPGRNFTFWAWFYAALKLIEKKDNNVKDLWQHGLIEGFIEREPAEALISRSKIGTFLLRFSDSITGAITIALHNKLGTVVSLNPFQMLNLQTKKLANSVKEIDKLRFLYQANGPIDKDEAFKKFYDTEVGNGYVSITSTIPEDSNNSSGSATPIPYYDGNRLSSGSLPGLPSPIAMEQQMHSPFLIYPPSPANSTHTFADPRSPVSVCDSQSQSGFLYVSNASTAPVSPALHQGELDTPLPPVSDIPMFPFSNEFDDLIKVIQRDSDITDIQME